MTPRVAPDESPAVAREVRDLLDAGRVTLPPMPEVVTRVLRLLRDDYDGPVGEIVDLVGSDAALASGILKVANSAMFGGLRQVSDLRLAIARLGVREVTSIVTMVAHKGQFQAASPARQAELRALWEHAVATALAARRLARGAEADPAETFLAGLLHDVGKLAVLRALEILEAGPPPRALAPAARDEIVATLHPEIGARILTGWKLPESACRVALRHHEPAGGAGDPLMACVRAANRLSRKLGAHPVPEPELSLLDLPEFEALDLGDLEIATLLVDVEEDLAQLRQLL